MTTKEHAMREFKAAGWVNEKGEWDCDCQKEICRGLLELLELFGTHGHSGSTAPYAINLFKKLASFEIITPLTGKDDEWNEVADNQWQNIRCSHVFKDADGKAYDIEGKIFKEPNGSCYTNTDSRVFVEFPYTPKKEYVDVEKQTWENPQKEKQL